MKRDVERTDDNGLLKPSEPLPLEEGQKVQETEAGRERAGLIRCSDSDLIERAALDKELEYEQ